MSGETRRHLSNINDSLKSQAYNLKKTRDHLLEHIDGLLKREKQLGRLKQQLANQLMRTQEQLKIQQKTKEPLKLFLKDELSQLDKKFIQGNLHIRNLEHQYEMCLGDYQKVTILIQAVIEGSGDVQNELSRLKESDVTMKAMIFDCQRLKRVLEEQRRYFKELCNSEQKSHQQRLKELNAIRKNIKQEQDTSTYSIRLSKLQIGLMQLHNFFRQKTAHYRDSFLRSQAKQVKVVKLGIKTFQNCLDIAQSKMTENIRRMFWAWHHNIFPKSSLSSLTQRALVDNEQSRIRIKILNQMAQKIHLKNTNMLHLYQKIKYIASIANKNSRKDKHYGFNLWRQSAKQRRRVSNLLEKAFLRVITPHLKRQYFLTWNKNARIAKRFQMASVLLSEFQTTRQVARVFRKWRFQKLHDEERTIRQYILRLQDHDKITRRINYQKRKMKVLTTLGLKIQKIKLRVYFNKYWCNTKNHTIEKLSNSIQNKKESLYTLRKATTAEANVYKAKDRNLLLHIFRDFVYRCKLVPVYKLWRNQSQLFKKQKRALMSLILRKQAKNKIYVMNQFRACVQHFQKKQMHQVLTDLNHKMENINQKSTQFRQLLKNCIQNLGVIASKKIDYISNYTLNYQQKLFFNTYLSKKINKTYKTLIIARLINIAQIFTQKSTFTSIKQYIKQNQKEINGIKKADQFIQLKLSSIKKAIFKWLKKLSIGHHRGFAKLIHIQNVFIYYRIACAFAALKRQNTAEKFKAMSKELTEKGNILEERKQNQKNLQNNKQKAENSLKQFFGTFITYQNRKQKLKQNERTHKILKKYLDKFRSTVRSGISKDMGAQNIANIVMNNNQFVFFRKLMVIRYEQLTTELKEELTKINKKRKTIQQKNAKTKKDIQIRMEEEVKVYNQCRKYYQFYSQRYEHILDYCSRSAIHNDKVFIKNRIFQEWKFQYKAAKFMISALQVFFVKKFLKTPYQLVVKRIKTDISRGQSRIIITELLEKKGAKLLRDTIFLWRTRIQKQKIADIEQRLHNLQIQQQQMKNQLKERAQLITKELQRVGSKKLKTKSFMAFKALWLKQQTNKRKINKLLFKRQKKYRKTAMICWKWDTYVQKIQKTYVPYKIQKEERQMKKSVFEALKFYRASLYFMQSRLNAMSKNEVQKFLSFCFKKIVNYSANQRDQDHYQRRKLMKKILCAKISKIKIIKRKIFYKWNALLISRTDYLPPLIKRLQLKILKSAFALINQKKYSNDIYIKDIADQVTNAGYNQVNGATNSLMREGYDPDQIKDYLKKRNDKDIKGMDYVIKHFRAWAKKESVVRAFHSWKQYVMLKQKIKKALNRVFNIAGGIGKYWSRWRAKDPHFNQILKKQSRGNMLKRYIELSRLLKEYHRDIRDNGSNLDQLIQINYQYKQKNRMGVLMALNACSNSIKKGMRQGLMLWRDKIYHQRKLQMDQRYQQIVQGLEMLSQHRSQAGYRIAVMRQENKQLKDKCMWGVQCGKILQRLLTEKDSLSIDLADKEHNLKLLLEDNIRLKQKIKSAQSNAAKLIKKIQQQDSSI